MHMGFAVHFDDRLLDYANFCRMNLLGLRMSFSRMHEARLDDTKLKGAKFLAADLQSSSMRRADLRQPDLSGVHDLAVDLSSCQLGGTKISLDSAYDSLALLGVQIGD
ncbi:MAG: pentapeptide repeat-containing protein [Deltaproteobacteria bacterium]|nr:pentapeptide repeat-containing protein [Deltaproteobacteria bacterium]